MLRRSPRSVRTGSRVTERSRILIPLVFGFAMSAIAMFASAHIVGAAHGISTSGLWNTLLPMVLVLCAVVDVVFPRMRPSLLNRQTPERLVGRLPLWFGGFVWGMDTGSVVSTYRASAASWTALVLTASQWGPWWTGTAYALAFCLPLTVLIGSHTAACKRGRVARWRSVSTESITMAMAPRTKYFRYASAIVALVAAFVASSG